MGVDGGFPKKDEPTARLFKLGFLTPLACLTSQGAKKQRLLAEGINCPGPHYSNDSVGSNERWPRSSSPDSGWMNRTVLVLAAQR